MASIPILFIFLIMIGKENVIFSYGFTVVRIFGQRKYL